MTLIDHFADQVRAFTDHELLAAYEKTGGVPGDTTADALLAEIKRRELDV